jgi:Fe-S cluster assembly protein SufD
MVNWIDVAMRSQHSMVKTHLNGEGALTTTKAFFIGKENQQYNLYTASCHNAAHTQSHLSTKGVLTDTSQGFSRGLIKIEKKAHSSHGEESMDTLLLSERAEADGLPILEIENNDVKCNHGTSIGQLDKEKLFYMMARGLSREDSIRMMIEGYFDPLLRSFTDEDMRTRIRSQIMREVNGINA